MQSVLNGESQNWRSPWWAVTAMFVYNGALYGMWASRIPAIAKTHALSPSLLGLLLLALAAGAIVSFPLAGRAADRFGAAPVTKRIAVAYCGTLILIAFAPTTWTLAAALFMFGAAHGAMDVTMNAWATEVERHLGRRVMSSFHAMFSVGAGAGAASGYIAVKYGLPVSMHFVVINLGVMALCLYVAALPWLSQHTSSLNDAGEVAAPGFMLPKGALFGVGVAAGCAALGEGAMADWSAIFLISVAGVGEASAALGYAVFSIAMVAMRLMGDRAVQVLGVVPAARLAGIAAMLGSGIAVLFATFPAILLGFALMGIGYAVIMPLAFTRAANDGAMAPGAAIASVSILGYGGFLLGPPLIGFAAEATSVQTAFLILTGLAVVISLLAGILEQKKAPPAGG